MLLLSTKALSAADVAYTVEITDMLGTPITAAKAGDLFQAYVFVHDLRGVGASGGVWAAYVDLTYDLDYVDWVAGSISWGPQFPNMRAGIIDEPNRPVDEVGGFGGFSPPGCDPAQLLFTVTGQVHDPVPGGVVLFSLNQADASPAHDTLVFGSNDPITAMSFGEDSLVVREPVSLALLGVGAIVVALRRRARIG